MALTSQTILHNGIAGDHREVYVACLTADGNGGAVQTGLTRIERIDVCLISNSDRAVDIYPNSKTASTTEDDPGWFFFQGTATAGRYRFLVMGR